MFEGINVEDEDEDEDDDEDNPNLMFEATNVEDHFRVYNLVVGYGGWVRLSWDMTSWHVLRSKEPALEYETCGQE